MTSQTSTDTKTITPKMLAELEAENEALRRGIESLLRELRIAKTYANNVHPSEPYFYLAGAVEKVIWHGIRLLTDTRRDA